MKGILLVGFGGFIGSVARYKLGGLVLSLTGAERFPLSTFTVNIIGCLIIGILAAIADRYVFFGQDMKLFFITGVLGGFTTFSSFGLEAMLLMRRDEFWVALVYASASVILGITAAWIGFKLVSLAPQ